MHKRDFLSMPEMVFCPIAELIFDKLTTTTTTTTTDHRHGGRSIDDRHGGGGGGNDSIDKDVDNNDGTALSFEAFIVVMDIFSMNIPVQKKAECK